MKLCGRVEIKFKALLKLTLDIDRLSASPQFLCLPKPSKWKAGRILKQCGSVREKVNYSPPPRNLHIKEDPCFLKHEAVRFPIVWTSLVSFFLLVLVLSELHSVLTSCLSLLDFDDWFIFTLCRRGQHFFRNSGIHGENYKMPKPKNT